MDGEPIEEREIARFTIWYNHDGVKRAADVRRLEVDGQGYFSCRLFNGTVQEIEPEKDEQGNRAWKLVFGEVSPLSTNLGKAIDEYGQK